MNDGLMMEGPYHLFPDCDRNTELNALNTASTLNRAIATCAGRTLSSAMPGTCDSADKFFSRLNLEDEKDYAEEQSNSTEDDGGVPHNRRIDAYRQQAIIG